jgi:SET family sugar efflux transporter-like MFS transporter
VPAPVPSTDLGRIARAARLLGSTPETRAVMACNVIMGLGYSFVMPFLSLFCVQEVGMSLPLFSVFMTVTALSNIAIGTVLAQKSDTQLSRRTLLLASTAAAAFGYLVYAYARAPWLLFVNAALVLGVASVGFSQLFAHARELIDRSRVSAAEAPLYLSTLRTCFSVSWTFGPAVAAFALSTWSFTGLFLSAATLHALLFLLIWRFVHTPPSSPRGKEQPLSVLAILRSSAVWPWFTAIALLQAAHTISMSNMSLFIVKELMGRESQVGVVFSLAPLFELPLMLYVGALASRVSSGRLLRFAAGLAVVYYVALTLVGAPWQIYPLQALSAAIIAVTSGVAIAFFQNKLPEQPGAATNLYSNAVRGGSTSGYLAFGLLAGQFGHRGTYAACALFGALALFLTLVFGRAEPARA